MRELRVRTIVTAIADAADRWHDADFPPRVRATRAIEARTSYREPVIDFALDALFASMDSRTIEATIAGELGDIAALDGFVSRANRPDVTYRGRSPIAIVSSDTTIGVALPTLVFGLCAKAHVRIKDRSDNLVRAFVETLSEELPQIAQAVTVETWEGASDLDASRAFAGTEAVVAFGRNETLAAIRNRLEPQTTFIGMGHRTSIAYVARESLHDESRVRILARELARDVLLYDGDGCLSAHTIFCETGGAIEPTAFARILARACDEAAIEFPAGYTEPDAAVVRYRDAARFRAAQGDGACFGGTIVPHLIVTDPPRDEPPPFLRRTAAVYSTEDPATARSFLTRHAVPLEAVALSERRADLETFAVASGASRVCAIGELQRPPLGGEHGGTGRISPLVRAIYRA